MKLNTKLHQDYIKKYDVILEKKTSEIFHLLIKMSSTFTIDSLYKSQNKDAKSILDFYLKKLDVKTYANKHESIPN